jgi:hypothetical protein
MAPCPSAPPTQLNSQKNNLMLDPTTSLIPHLIFAIPQDVDNQNWRGKGDRINPVDRSNR